MDAERHEIGLCGAGRCHPGHNGGAGPLPISRQATSGDWSVASNWGGTLPTSTSYAYISNGGTAAIAQAGETCGTLSLGDVGGSGNVQMTGGGLTAENSEVRWLFGLWQFHSVRWEQQAVRLPVSRLQYGRHRRLQPQRQSFRKRLVRIRRGPWAIRAPAASLSPVGATASTYPATFIWAIIRAALAPTTSAAAAVFPDPPRLRWLFGLRQRHSVQWGYRFIRLPLSGL